MPFNSNHRRSSFYGFYHGIQPVVSLCDPKLIKRVLHEDFDHFVDHMRWAYYPDVEPLIGHSLYALNGDRWHAMRQTLSPAFGSGRVRAMFPLIAACSQRSVSALRERTATHANEANDGGGGEQQPVNISDMLSRFAHDVIATVAFGVEVNSIAEPDNAFYRTTMRGVNWTSWRAFGRTMLACYTCRLPWPRLRVRMFDAEVVRHFTALVMDAMRYRKEYDVQRTDMIQMMMDARDGYLRDEPLRTRTATATAAPAPVPLYDEEGQPIAASERPEMGSEEYRGIRRSEWLDEEVTAQCFMFFATGYGTVHMTLNFIVYELAVNPIAQQRLVDEVDALRARLDGRPCDYGDMDALVYMEQVIAETMRLWPCGPVLVRACVKDYQLDDGRGRRIDMKAGDCLFIPIAGLQLDERYFADAQRFDPDRFGAVRKGELNPFTYLPFGSGPRNCIGARFAMVELKAFLFHLFGAFRVERTERTQVPLRLKCSGYTVEMERPLDVRLVRRDER